MRNALSTIAVIGILGGAALIATVLTSTRGQLILIPYVLTVVACGYALRATRLTHYAHRFWTAFVALSSALLLAESYIVFVIKPGHLQRAMSSYLWPVVFAVATSAIVGAVLARVTAVSAMPTPARRADTAP